MGLFIISFIAYVQTALASVPSPADTAHPGNETAVLSFERKTINALGRQSFLYLPDRPQGDASPLIVFGHGQALNESHYDKTLEHLAKKGVAALFVQYDDGFFDQDWRRMADDWNQITEVTLDEYQNQLAREHIIYSGHSKGGYVGLMAAGAPGRPDLAAAVFFAPAGFDQDYLKNIDTKTAITLVWGEKDSIIKKNDVMEIFNKLSIDHKQFIEVLSYQDQQADHYFPQNKATFFGGQDGVSAYHHHGVWQWLVAAAWDAEKGEPLTQAYLYGEKAGDSGKAGLTHKVTRNWQTRFEYVFKFKSAERRDKVFALIPRTERIGHGWYKAVLDESQRQVVKRTGEVQYIGRNIELKLLAEPNDLHPNQWAFFNDKGFDISAPAAWDISVGHEDIVVGVIDSGIQWSHGDLQDNIWNNPVELNGTPGVDDDQNGYVDDVKGYHFLLNSPESNDTRGHGTMVSGMIGAKGNNGFGITGMAWNVKLMPLNMFPNLWGNATLDAAVKAMNYAVDNKVDIINASFGQADDDLVPDEGFNIFIEAVERADQQGIPIVAAAGNSSGDNDKTGMIPATLPHSNIISVGAMNRYGEKWAKTNYGLNSVHVMAPGEEILTTHTSGTRSPSGTSLSAPIVTGIVVLMLEQNPDLTPTEIKEILIESCDSHPPLASMSQCGGYINAHRAVLRASEIIESP